MSNLHILGIRHHGPGSARMIANALTTLKPTRILIEGPPDADDILNFAASEAMKPPVSILVYQTDDARKACYYPFARFSPEWVAIRWALREKIPVRFMDWPQAYRMAFENNLLLNKKNTDNDHKPDEDEDEDEKVQDQDEEKDKVAVEIALTSEHIDPLTILANHAGFEDGERWWEHLVEQNREQPIALFDSIREAMAALREEQKVISEVEQKREAWMRKTIREEQKLAKNNEEEVIIVICGAWHSPVLTEEKVKELKSADDALLKNLPKVKTTATWVPWTYGRLTFASGYGAGVHCPGWYDHLWGCEKDVLERWLARAAKLIRSKDIDCSSAHVIEATRLARNLAGFRGRPLPDLADISDATRSVFCYDNDAPIKLIERDLLISERIGEVPEDAPAVPLQQDLNAEMKRLRLKAEALEKTIELDLRQQFDRERSHLFYRLRLLGIEWGEIASTTGKGTFKEAWRLRWQPEFAVQIVEKSPLGNTILLAASAAVRDLAAKSMDLPELAETVSSVLLADLPDAADYVLNRVANVASVAADITTLMKAVGPLADVSRYGTVRKTDTELVTQTINGLLPRIFIGLVPAVSSLADEAAAIMDQQISTTDKAVQLIENPEHLSDWQHCLKKVVADDVVHGLVRGGSARRLFDAAAITQDDVALLVSQSLSKGNDLAQSANWLEGFFRGSGLLLIHDARLLKLVDEWVKHVPADQFDEFLPLVRRTFSTFPKPERRQIGNQLKSTQEGETTAKETGNIRKNSNINMERAKRIIPLLEKLLRG